jgi:hypothetical protein
VPIYYTGENGLNINDTVIISADFECYSNKNIISGAYGVRLDVYTRDSEDEIAVQWFLTSEEFFGNPYKFRVPIK